MDALAHALRKIISDETQKQSASATAKGKSPNNTVTYPAAVAASPEAAADELAENFDLLEERDAKNQYVIDLGDALPHTFDLLKQVTTRVAGCMSEVYVVTRRSPGDEHVLEFVADANADIVRGLIAILQRLYSGQRVDEVLAFDIESFFRRIGLDQFITSQRRNGLAGMINRIRASAKALSQTESKANSTV
ncbi:MAG TPA: SufE family protein [Tepidisphaeraceae bacterium]|nr:SufE family protein [Tepidisphaeraceae bacterium]